ncbi:MAG: ATP-dependent Clp protease adaptor ClpS [Thermoanaerobaculia bacterium]|nr:ATP-dependent Clp protease adaptor ClpS [Thermoanaerobaculia bacterium]
MAVERKGDPDSQVLEKTRTKKKVKRPPLYKVLFHNDDYTPMEFVVLLLMQVFSKGETEATTIMLHVHNNGVGVAGLYPFAVAETKVAEAMAAAEKAQYPLLVTLEPAGDDDDPDGPSS